MIENMKEKIETLQETEQEHVRFERSNGPAEISFMYLRILKSLVEMIRAKEKILEKLRDRNWFDGVQVEGKSGRELTK